MNRQQGLIAGLVVVAVAVVFYLFLWQPRSEEIAELQAQREAVDEQIAQLERRREELVAVRAEAPEAEADVVAAETIIPLDLALPSALRQFQLAADEAGATLVNVSPSRPQQVVDAEPGVAAIEFSMQATGGYYQLVDFLRRIEDPTISPRGIIWSSMSITGSVEEYPTLTAAVSGRMFAVLPVPPQPEPTPTEGATPDGEGTPDAGTTDAATPAGGGS